MRISSVKNINMNKIVYNIIGLSVIILYWIFRGINTNIAIWVLGLMPVIFILLDFWRRKYLERKYPRMPKRPVFPITKKYWNWLVQMRTK